MSARIRPFKPRRASVCGLVVLVCLVLPASATAAAPTCQGGQFSVLHGRTLVLPAAPCAGGNGTLTLQLVTAPLHGDLGFVGGGTSGTPQYTADRDYVGPDSFSYKATDQTPETSNTATVTMTVTDQAPTCNDTSTTTKAGQAVDISNLFDCDDADGEAFTIFFGDGDHGVTDANGTTYTPDAGFVGTDRVLFQGDDGALQSPLRAITIVVTASPPPPPPPPPPVAVTPKDTSPPVFSLTHPKQSLGDARTGGVKLAETSNEAGTLTITIKVDKRTARKLKINPKAKGPVTVGTVSQAIGAGKRAFTVKLTAKARKALKRGRSVTLLITVRVVDAAGNATTRAMTLTLKR